MRNYVEDIRKKGIAIVDFNTKEQLNKIITECEEIPNVNWFRIKYKNQSSVVIKPTAILTEDMSLKDMYLDAKVAYLNKNYRKCLELNQNILLYDAPPKVFLQIAKCYFYLDKATYAMDYLKVASSLDKTLELDSLIKTVENKMIIEKARKESDDFSLYNIDNYEEIISLYHNSESFDDIFAKLNLDFNQRSLVYIAFAKEYYHLGIEKLGDKYLYLAEKQPDKNKYTNLLISEVRKMKKLYIHKDVPVLLLKKNNLNE